MSGRAILGKLLSTHPAFVAYAGVDKVYDSIIPERATPPFALLHIVGNARDQFLGGQGQSSQTRVSVEINGKPGNARSADRMATMAVDILGGLVEKPVEIVVDGQVIPTIATIWPAGSDVSDYEPGTDSLPRRILDFYVRFRLA